ncbi:cytoskeleton protein RodZ [Xenorhabdus szentirmaii]|uniref:Cytoskeleton protein rodZ n=2 Tax=Xenorhabdus szentirmaii TaxID=290112 RepID=W1ITJ0_9GAMM|nr:MULTISPECIES: cytoskeleton protein RodZ [Xenorhabdus]MBD2792943.1 cytoskeleton protein RodZ [Xenorhabdus sp. CUL]MBD2800871.1 cytoskeleton protein RodZ [Xenorhabdus sp. M]MBD2820484.1 cytoskeleton protein RodZ [Xenorhabdus sp. 42]MBD2826915.1 cytoskeleton protein RodZ [Xenorhabdus sp. 5]PHM30730.1 cytoskeletal protein RodZ [Xenorhabdus szentirmaii DSM 16338]
MKTETYPEEANLTAGQILRQAREKIELSQQNVADRLCLKLSTVRDIEEDTVPSNIAPTFFRGYIRAYAKLVQVPEPEILGVLDKQIPSKTIKTSPMQSFSAGKTRKKRDGWLMKLTWVVIIVLLGMTCLWWWQNYKAQQTELSSMAAQSNAHIATGDEQNLGNSAASADTSSASLNENKPVVASPAQMAQESGTKVNANTQVNTGTSASSVPVNQSATTQAATSTAAALEKTSPALNNAGANSVANPASSDAGGINAPSTHQLLMNFKGECWVQVLDAKGEVLFRGLKYKGDSLNLSGEVPYSLKIGVPKNVDIQFQGKPVDLSTFIRKGIAAKLTLK